jgi:hypothetical protein
LHHGAEHASATRPPAPHPATYRIQCFGRLGRLPSPKAGEGSSPRATSRRRPGAEAHHARGIANVIFLFRAYHFASKPFPFSFTVPTTTFQKRNFFTFVHIAKVQISAGQIQRARPRLTKMFFCIFLKIKND